MLLSVTAKKFYSFVPGQGYQGSEPVVDRIVGNVDKVLDEVVELVGLLVREDDRVLGRDILHRHLFYSEEMV